MSEKADSTNASLNTTDTGAKPEMPAVSFEAPADTSTDTSFQLLPPFVDAKTKVETMPVELKASSTLPANLLTTATSVTWIATLIYHGAAGQSLPWCITLAVVAFWALTATRKQVQKHALAASRIGLSEEGRLTRAISTTYLTVSMLAFAWFSVHGFKPPTPLITQKQFIDIELTSFADFKDNKAFVASTEEKDSQRKRSGSTDKVSMTPPVVQTQSKATDRTSKKTEEAGKRALQAVAPQKLTAAPTEMVLKGVQVQSAVNSQEAAIQAQQQKAQTRARLVSQVKLPSGWKSIQADQTMSTQNNITPGVKSEQSRAANQSMFMEESSPVELFEVVDNEGDAGTEIFQAGGRSTGGKGAPSNLQDYLKLLHKRIKRAWSPPNGDPRVAQILFRIDKSGKLKQIRLVRSSGHSDCDEAAMNAISACAPFKGLPADFPSDCLDIKYTFNYKVDSLSEVSDGKLR
ncbi:MAG: hypothetical protein C0469_07845 [Cyanobacteria bacterium DS2.3.42]|nr:hypothetical protein [Cyanobacteria bacterium DS2.3.42]